MLRANNAYKRIPVETQHEAEQVEEERKVNHHEAYNIRKIQ